VRSTLRLPPFAGRTAGGVPNPLDMGRNSWTQFPHPLDGFRLRRQDRAGALRVCSPNRVVALQSPFDVGPLVSHFGLHARRPGGGGWPDLSDQIFQNPSKTWGFCRAGGEKCPRNFRRGAVPIVEISGRVDGNRGLSLVKTSAASVQVVLTNTPSYFRTYRTSCTYRSAPG
jgi:hypothetical protein